jgi:signal transduction histidine kinase/ligand-binding sensor domain-containing protein
MALKFQLIIFLIFICTSGFVNSQKLSLEFNSISYRDGLPTENVRVIFKDKLGIIWLSIEDQGVCKYYGNKFKVYQNEIRNENSLSNNFVNTINEDSYGNIWFGTENGLNRYDRKSDKIYRYYYDPNDKFSILSNKVFCIYKTKNDKLLIGTDKGLCYYVPETNNFRKIFDTVFINNINEIIPVRYITETDFGNIWIGSTCLIKYQIRDGKYKVYNIKNSLPNTPNNVNSIYPDTINKQLWIGTTYGLNLFSYANEVFIPFEVRDKKLNESFIRDIGDVVIIDNIAWISSYTRGIIIYDLIKKIFYSVNVENYGVNGFSSNFIRELYYDKTGILWIGTKFGGLMQYFPEKLPLAKIPEKYFLFENIKDKFFLSFFADTTNDKEIYWVGTLDNGLYKIDIKKQKIVNFNTGLYNKKGLITNRFNTIFIASDKLIFVGTDRGLAQLKKEIQYFKFYDYNFVNIIYEDAQKTIWIGEMNGIFVYNKNQDKLERVKSKNSFFQSDKFDIMEIWQDKAGLYWFLTRNNGLFIYNKKEDTIKNISNLRYKGFSGKLPRAILMSADNKIWIGDKINGLFCYESMADTFFQYTIEDGLSSNMILSIVEDDSKNLWLGTHNGLCYFNLKTKTFKNYYIKDGLRNNIYHYKAYGKLKGGYLIFGGNNGFNIFNSSEITNSGDSIILMINSVSFNGKEVLCDLINDSSIVLPYKNQNIEIGFNTLNYRFSGAIQLEYMLKGVDENWYKSSLSQSVIYHGLKPGKYSFLVRNIKDNNNYNNKILELDIIIKAPLWYKVWFKMTIVLVLIIIILSIIYFRINNIKKQKAYLEKIVKERTAEIENKNQELETIIEELNKTNSLLEEKHHQLETQTEVLKENKKQLEDLNQNLLTSNALLKERQEFIEQQSEQLKEQTEKLKKMNNELQELNATKDKFISIIAHDLRNPIGTALGFAELVKSQWNEYSNEKKEKLVNIIYVLILKINELLNDLLDWARAQTGKIKVYKEFFNLSNITDECYLLLKSSFSDKQNIFSKKIPDDLMIYADKKMISTVLRNLLTNANKFTEKGTITVEAIKENDFWKISVSDTGIGIPPEKQETIFKIANEYILNGTRGETGTGLGLLLCKEFVERNGGKISILSKEGKGTTIYFTIPVQG